MNNFYSLLLKRVLLPLADKAMKTKLMSYYIKIQKMKGWSSFEIENWQNKNLQSLVLFAYNNTEYYKELFDKHSINPLEIQTVADLSRIPVLTKEDIILNYDRIIPNNISSIKHKKSATGGSTGDPMKYLLDVNSWSFSNANNILNWERTSYTYGARFMALGSSSININKKKSIKHLFYYRLKNKVSLSGVNMSDEVCRRYIKIIKKQKIRFIYGYSSAIYLLAKYAKDNDCKLNIEACFSTSEILTSLYKETIEDTFNCKVINCYGAHDGGITAYSNNDGRLEVGYNCVVKTSGIESSNISSALLTDLLNYAMPLINYQLGDEIILEKKSNHSYNGQVIKELLGRTSDVIKLENGRTLTGPGFTVLFKELPVLSYSIKKSSSNSITCIIQKTKEYNKYHEDIIIQSLQKQAGIDSIIIINYVEKLGSLKNGKRNYFISE